MGAQEKENKGVELTGGGRNCGKADGGRNCSSEKSKLSSIFLVGCISISGLEALGKGGTGSAWSPGAPCTETPSDYCFYRWPGICSRSVNVQTEMAARILTLFFIRDPAVPVVDLTGDVS